MHRYEWTDELTLGDDNLDAQHRTLIEEVNRMLDACKMGDGVCQLESILASIERYAIEHFRDEEEFQKRLGYPDLEEHREEHRRFLADFGALKGQFENSGATFSLVIKTNSFVTNWLSSHLAEKDRELARFVAFGRSSGTYPAGRRQD